MTSASTSGIQNSLVAWLQDPIILMEIIAGQFKAEVSSLLDNYVLKFESDMSKYNEIHSSISDAVIRKLDKMVKTNISKMMQLLDEVDEERRNRFDSPSVGLPSEPAPPEETKQAVSEALKELMKTTNKTEEDDCSGDTADSQVENEEDKIIYILVSDSDDDSVDDDHPDLHRNYYGPESSSPLQDKSEESPNDSLIEDLLARDRILMDLDIEGECDEEEMEEQTQEEEQVMVKQEVNDDIMAGHDQTVYPFHHNNEPGQQVLVKQEANEGMAGHQAIRLFHLNNKPGEQVTVKAETDDSAMADF